MRVYAEVGQVPIVVRREIDGFILNRLQGALLSEAMRLVGEGYVSPEDLDKTVRDGLGLRWSFMGPIATIELNAPGGVADYCARYGGALRRLAEAAPAASVWDAGNVGRVAAALGAPTPAPPSVWDPGIAGRVAAALGTPPPADVLEARTRWRDRRLMALARHKLDQSNVE